MKAVFLDFATYYPEGLDVAALEASVDDFVFHDFTAPEDIIDRVKDAEIILTNKCNITAEVIAACPDLKIIIEGATGYNNIDVDAARDAGIPVCNVKGYSTPSVTQHVFAFILALNTRVTEYHKDVQQGKWETARDFCFLDYPIYELAGKMLGIIGYGDLGRSVEGIAKAFGMEVLLADHKDVQETRTGRTPFADVIARSDVITLHCPLMDNTRDLIAAAELAAMKDNAVLINTARGGIVNEGDLADALRRGVIGGAGVDVLSQEPPRDGNPLLDPDIPNLILTPHTAWASREACQRLFDQLVEVIDGFKSGELMNRVA
ncbi:MAG: D-2-hydroxyacid dehydrogenase [Alphaproteobacteria bacterium]